VPGFEPRFISPACGFATVPTELGYSGSFPSDIEEIFLVKTGGVMVLKRQNGTRKMLLVCLVVYATRLFTFDSPGFVCFTVFVIGSCGF
jgi:hypothetical protein